MWTTVNLNVMEQSTCCCSCLPTTSVAWKWSDCPVAMQTLHYVGSPAITTGFVYKSKGHNTVGMCLQLKVLPRVKLKKKVKKIFNSIVNHNLKDATLLFQYRYLANIVDAVTCSILTSVVIVLVL